MYLFFKYTYYFRHYVIDSITLLLILWEFLQTKFVLFMVFNLLVNLYFLVSFVISHWAQTSTNHTLPHPLMMTPLFSFIYTPQRKSGHKLAWITHQDNFNHFTFTFRDGNSEYQDHMDITKCIPSIKISGLSLTDPLEQQVTLGLW